MIRRMLPLLICACLTPGCGTPPANSVASGSVPLEDAALSNAWRVDDHLIRCAQPDAEGMKALAARGVRTVVNLRRHHGDTDEIEGTRLWEVRIPINTWNLRDEHVVAFLRLTADPDAGPFAVHCQHGADRTGVMCAMYRIIVMGWSRDAAIAEMTRTDHGFHRLWTNLVSYVRNADLEKIRRGAGL